MEPEPDNTTPSFYPENVPQPMQDMPNWLAYSLTKNPKAPRSVAAPRFPCDPTDPDHWAEFDAAVECADTVPIIDGIGFGLRTKDSIVCFDFDHCVEGGKIVDDNVADIVKGLDSYTEFGPSGDGLHVWVNASVRRVHTNKNWVEIYNDEKYVTVTGNVFDGRKKLRTVTDDSVQKLIDSVVGSKAPAKEHPAAQQGDGFVSVYDKKAVKKIRDGEYETWYDADTDFAAIWDGRYKDCSRIHATGSKLDSEADIALCLILSEGKVDDPQVLVNWMLAKREHNKEDMYLQRLGKNDTKFAATALKALEDAPLAIEKNKIVEAETRLRNMSVVTTATDDTREQVRLDFSDMVGWEVLGIWKLSKENSLYEIEFIHDRDDYTRVIGKARAFRDRNKWTDLMMDYRMVMPKFPDGEGKVQRWKDMIGAVMLHLVTEDDRFKDSVSDEIIAALEDMMAGMRNEEGRWIEGKKGALAGAAIGYLDGAVWCHMPTLKTELVRMGIKDDNKPIKQGLLVIQLLCIVSPSTLVISCSFSTSRKQNLMRIYKLLALALTSGAPIFGHSQTPLT
ncbi:MAG TPA: hypothetical protein DDW55_13865 [Gammaproteobacteria bacterium]|nr:hypothetical protein [Gammaproteobacteria bacterium]